MRSANPNTSQGALATALQRLSSGLRINSAKDDADKLAISERCTAQICGETAALTQAQILQQAGTAMRARANAIPNNLLTLFR